MKDKQEKDFAYVYFLCFFFHTFLLTTWIIQFSSFRIPYFLSFSTSLKALSLLLTCQSDALPFDKLFNNHFFFNRLALVNFASLSIIHESETFLTCHLKERISVLTRNKHNTAKSSFFTLRFSDIIRTKS